MKPFYRFMKGYVVVDATGLNVERLITICARNHIEVWQIEYRTPYCIRFSISLGDYVRIRGFAVKLNIRMKHISRHGLAFVLRHWQNKVAFILAVLVLAFSLFYVHNHVWGFVFEGNDKVTDSMLEDFLTGRNIVKGCRMKDIDFHETEKELRQEFPSVTWVSMGMENTSLKVKLVEEVVPFLPKKEDYNASSLYSMVDGTVQDLIVREGKAYVKKSNHVSPGDLLVSGMLQYTDNNGSDIHTSYLNADADILLSYREEFDFITNSRNLWYECRDPLCDYLTISKLKGLNVKLISNRRENTHSESSVSKWHSEILVSGGGVLRKEISRADSNTGEEIAYE